MIARLPPEATFRTRASSARPFEIVSGRANNLACASLGRTHCENLLVISIHWVIDIRCYEGGVTESRLQAISRRALTGEKIRLSCLIKNNDVVNQQPWLNLGAHP